MMAIISGISIAYEYNSHIGRTCRALTWKRKHKIVATSYSRVESLQRRAESTRSVSTLTTVLRGSFLRGYALAAIRDVGVPRGLIREVSVRRAHLDGLPVENKVSL